VSNARCFKRLDAAEAETAWAAPNSCERFSRGAVGALLGQVQCSPLRKVNCLPSDRRACGSLDVDCSAGKSSEQSHSTSLIGIFFVFPDYIRLHCQSNSLQLILVRPTMGAPSDHLGVVRRWKLDQCVLSCSNRNPQITMKVASDVQQRLETRQGSHQRGFGSLEPRATQEHPCSTRPILMIALGRGPLRACLKTLTASLPIVVASPFIAV
jgi:hypothetical protein